MQTQQIDDLRRQYSITGILGIPKKKPIVCPLPRHSHSNNTASFSVFVDFDGFERFRCHGNCAAIGDVVDLIGYMEVPGYSSLNTELVKAAMSRLQERTGGIVVPELARLVKVPKISPALWKTMVPPSENIVNYLKGRGLTTDTLMKFHIGNKGSLLAMPTFEEGILKNIKYRRTIPSGKKMRYFEEEGSVKSLFNHDAVAWNPLPILVTKGHIPTMLMDQFGVLACNSTSGENASLADWFPRLAVSRRRIYIGDNDTDPRIREKMQSHAKHRADEIHGELYFPPEEFKDLDEWVITNPGEAIPIVKHWLGV